jgi:hypothetical protein
METPMANGLRAVPLAKARLHGDECIETPIGRIELAHNYVDDDASERLFDEMDYQRAAQAYIWSTPLVSMTTWRDRQGRSYGVTDDTDFVILESLREQRGIVTGNLAAPYIVNFFNLKTGPLQITYPAGGTVGEALDFWQRPLCDLGWTGPDAGKGATYIIAGPEAALPRYDDAGVHVYQSVTNNILIGLRVLEKDADGLDTFTAAFRMGRVGQTLGRSRFIKGKNVEWSATAPRGLEYWRTLSAIVNEEPVREVDKAWLAMLLPLGIAKGHHFDPDKRQQEILLNGAAMGELMTRNLQINPRHTQPYWPGTYWFQAFDFHTEQEVEDRIELDERATWFYEAVSSPKGRLNPTIGAGQIYTTTKRDSQGRMLRADKTYKLHVPKVAVVGHFWALTLYSENTRRPYDNGGTEIRSVFLDSTMSDLKRDPDGGVDIYIGATAPADFQKNFLQTVGDDGWFVYFRLGGQRFFDKAFALGDFERLD